MLVWASALGHNEAKSSFVRAYPFPDNTAASSNAGRWNDWNAVAIVLASRILQLVGDKLFLLFILR
jgi:hypothetical protein